MDLLSWMVLLFLLSAGTSLAAVDVNWLTSIVINIRKEYTIKDQFCLAANIPQNQVPNTLNTVLQNDGYDKKVNPILESAETYQGTNVVVAKPVGPVHAEPEVLKNLQPLIRERRGKFLLIYSYLSPCGGKCTNSNTKHNILKEIKNYVLPNWKNVAFVFTKVFDKPKYGSAPSKEDLINSLTMLGDSGLGLQNIFRCDGPTNLELQCYSCSSQSKVSDVCVENDAVPGQGGSNSSRKRHGDGSENESSSSKRPRRPDEQLGF